MNTNEARHNALVRLNLINAAVKRIDLANQMLRESAELLEQVEKMREESHDEIQQDTEGLGALFG